MKKMLKFTFAQFNAYFTYDEGFPGNPTSPDSRPSTRRSKNKNRKAKAGRRAARLNRG